MKNLIFIVLVLLFSMNLSAAENICPVPEKAAWDKMKESDFSITAVNEALESLKKVFSGEIEVSEEFVWQTSLVIEGGYLLREVGVWKNYPENLEISTDRFCDFMKKKHSWYIEMHNCTRLPTKNNATHFCGSARRSNETKELENI